MSLMFPGFRGEALADSEDLPDITKSRVRNLRMRLKPEIVKVLAIIRRARKRKRKPMRFWISSSRSFRRSGKFFGRTIDASYEGDPAAKSYEEIILAYPSLEAIAIYRMAHLLYNKVPLIPRIMTEWAHSRTGIDIHPGAEIGLHFFIDHGRAWLLARQQDRLARETLSRCVVHRAVARGRQALRGKKRHPTIEDGVCIYAGTTIMGGDTVIGANSTIGANVFLTKAFRRTRSSITKRKNLRSCRNGRKKSRRTPADSPNDLSRLQRDHSALRCRARSDAAYFSQHFGNPSSIHRAGRNARAAVDNARDKIAGLIKAKPNEIIFTSGATESCNLAVLGLARCKMDGGGHIISNKTEHHAVLTRSSIWRSTKTLK